MTRIGTATAPTVTRRNAARRAALGAGVRARRGRARRRSRRDGRGCGSRLRLLINFLAVGCFMPGAEAPLTIPYTLFKDEVGKHNVAVDLQPRRDADRPLRGAGHVSAGRVKRSGAGRAAAQGRARHAAARSAANVGQLRHDAAGVRRIRGSSSS